MNICIVCRPVIYDRLIEPFNQIPGLFLSPPISEWGELVSWISQNQVQALVIDEGIPFFDSVTSMPYPSLIYTTQSNYLEQINSWISSLQIQYTTTPQVPSQETMRERVNGVENWRDEKEEPIQPKRELQNQPTSPPDVHEEKTEEFQEEQQEQHDDIPDSHKNDEQDIHQTNDTKKKKREGKNPWRQRKEHILFRDNQSFVVAVVSPVASGKTFVIRHLAEWLSSEVSIIDRSSELVYYQLPQQVETDWPNELKPITIIETKGEREIIERSNLVIFVHTPYAHLQEVCQNMLQTISATGTPVLSVVNFWNDLIPVMPSSLVGHDVFCTVPYEPTWVVETWRKKAAQLPELKTLAMRIMQKNELSFEIKESVEL